MLVTLNEVLKDAKKNQYAVGLFNTVNLEMARGVIKAAEEARSPVIIGTAEVLLPFAPLEELSWLLVPMAKAAKVPVVLHYDHGLTEAMVMKAIRLGFSSVMYDCSCMSYQDNIRACKKLTKFAHLMGVTVEAELGHVGANDGASEGSGGDNSIYTEAAQAAEYVERTEVDALAVAIGTDTIGAVVDALPQAVLSGLDVVAAALPALGFAMLLNIMWDRRFLPFYFIGFALAVYFGVDIMAVTVLAVAVRMALFVT